MVSYTLKAVAALAAVAFVPSVTARLGISYEYPDNLAALADPNQRNLGNCHDCDCFTCDSVSEKDDGSLDVKIGHCKDGSISWMCCVGTDGKQGNCPLASCSGSQEGSKCNGIGKGEGLMINIPKSSVDFQVNTHDGQTQGDADMQNAVCGGNGNQGGGCAEGGATAHCLKTFNLVDDCGYTSINHGAGGPSEPEPEPAPENEGKECPADVDPCWDGSFVSRVLPDCDFEACPENPNQPEPEQTGIPTTSPTALPTVSPTDGPTSTPTPAPTDSPTVSPTLQPTVASGHPSRSPTTGTPTVSPTDEPTDAPTGSPRTPPPVTKPPKTDAPISTPPGSFGDPHVKVWNGETFDFHGSCDLVLLDNPSFHDGLGMSIHIRTKIVTWWSFIESAVVRIGSETIEVSGGKQHKYYVNGVEGDYTAKNLLFSELGLKVLVKQATGHQLKVRIDLLNADAIGLETFKEFVRVNIKMADPKWKKFDGSTGLMGEYPTGVRFGRDGKTVFTDMNAFGQEWQVRESEPMLFHNIDGPQYPTKCLMPEEATTEQKRRRLGESMLTREDAELACARVGGIDHDACVFDVLATNDKEMAGSY